ncbi:MAG: ABC transporter ATP-binding protein [Deltaproteobacteria bacterium]|nr:ABC transporter ATP-binding protein [Deltaproteobacteria bacterium]
MTTSQTTPLLQVDGLGKTYPVGGILGRRRRLRALHDVSFTLDRGEAVALVGESGSGKSTIARQIIRLERPDRGVIRLDGVDVLVSERRRASLGFRRRVQMIFQDPFGSLNPHHTIAHHLARPLLRHDRAGKGDVADKVLALLSEVGLDPAADYAGKHPHALSGGQRQRVAIARALAPGPDLVLADEPTSMLDVSLRMGILNLLAHKKKADRLALLFITHDLASARYLADRILVLYAGQVMEAAPADALVAAPRHPYTRLLLSAVSGSGHLRTPVAARPGRPELVDPPAGCPFAARCPEAVDACRRLDPPVIAAAPGHAVRCHLASSSPGSPS